VISWTPWRAAGALAALVIPTAVVVLAGASSVARVGDVGHIPPGIPLPQLPDFGLHAGWRTLLARLPDPGGCHAPAVVLRLRGRTSLGATFIKVVTHYTGRLAEVDGRLYLSGMDPGLTEQLRRAGRLEGTVRAFAATPLLGESTEPACRAAQAWLVRKQGE
jgi:hypothetical protein